MEKEIKGFHREYNHIYIEKLGEKTHGVAIGLNQVALVTFFFFFSPRADEPDESSHENTQILKSLAHEELFLLGVYMSRSVSYS